ncbi:MAG: right-handed parallel beta-helix repeat-containing protein, partial [Phycisphaerae bacterium]|nr:right-handed parallel beta-helix repeat-containing protein [Phycisphaerae bacterium]
TTVGNSYGGAICNWNSSDPNIANCIFTANDADMGGGLYNNYSSPNITNCIFVGNTADSYGGGMYNYYESYPVVVNSIFSGNRADIYGGGMYNAYSNVNLTNSILWANEAYYYDEIYNYGTSNLNVTFCDVKGGWSGGVGNINEDPCFFSLDYPDGSWSENAAYDSSTFQSTLTDENANWAVNQLAGKFVNPYTDQYLQFFIVSNNVNTIKVWSNVESIALTGKTYHIYDYHLRVESACIDTGDPNGDYKGQTDIDGEPRVFDGDYNEVPIVDMGADEYYWSQADFNTDGLVNFFDYAFFASAWLTDPNNQYYNEICDLVDNNCIDSNDLARFCEDWLWQTAWARTFPFAYEQAMGRGMGKSMAESLDLLTQDLFVSVSAEKSRPQLTADDIEQMIKWLAELWLTDDDVRNMISADDWLKFTESAIETAKQLLYN